MLALFVLAARAQVAPPPTSPTDTTSVNSSGEQPVVLAPFVLEASQDRGYVAQNTVSGTRLNTPLKDTPIAVSVFTSQFIQDIDATSIADIVQYAPNVRTDYGIAAGNVSNGNALSTGDATFHVRGQPTSASGNRLVDLFQFQIEEDAFNIQRLEASRGPNTLLFGLGSAAGIFNVVSKTADDNRTFASGTFRYGSYNSAREAVDVNAPIISGKLALRVNAVVDDEGSWRPHEFKDAKRLAVALHYQISPKYSFDSEYEGGHVNASVQRPWADYDSITAWRAAGSNIIATAGAAIPANSGVQSISANDFPMFTTNTSQLYDWKKMSQSQDTFSSTAPLAPMLFSFALVPRAATLAGAAAGSNSDYSHVSEFLRGEVIPHLFVELAYDHQRVSYLGRDIGNNNLRIYYDTNAQLPTGAPNPYVGQPYIESLLYHRNRWDFADDYRATVTYEFNLGKIFGHHQFAGLAEARSERIPSMELEDALVQNPYSTAAPETGTNLVRQQTYVNLGGPVAGIALPTSNLNLNGQTNSSSALPVTTAYVPDTNVHDDRYFQTTLSAVLQSDFWQRHLVTTLGYREDRLDTRLGALVRGPAYNSFVVGNYFAQQMDNVIVTKGNTRTLGGVINATSWLGIFYNAADSFTLPDHTITLPPNLPAPAPTGKSEDLGLKLNLIHGQLYATATYYQTKSQNNTSSLPTGLSATSAPTYVNEIFQTLDAAGDLAANGLSLANVQSTANGYTYDSRSQGWEFELVANPTSDLRLYTNVSINQTTDTNIGTQYMNYIGKYQSLFQKYGTLPLTTGATATVVTVNDAYNQIIQSEQTTFVEGEGALELGNPKYTANLVAEYTFSKGWMKGIFGGIADRYSGRLVIGYTTLDPATRQPIETASNNLIDVNLGYRHAFRLWTRMVEWRLQANMMNVLDNNHILVTRAYGSSASGAYTPYTPRTYKFQLPQQWTVSNTLSF